MRGDWGHRGPRRVRRRTRTATRRLAFTGWLVACLLSASTVPVAASARPIPGGFGDLVGRHPWAGWFVKPPIDWAIWAAWPHVTCESADGAWHADNVTVACTAFDVGSGLADPADASFTLSTNVPAGAADAAASTGSRTICNAVGNCRVAAPIGAIRVDRQRPDILALVTPMAGPYPAGPTVRVDFLCTDPGSGIRWCPRQVTLDTTFTGSHSVSFQAIDVAGNVRSTVVDYRVEAGSSYPMIILPAPRGEWI